MPNIVLKGTKSIYEFDPEDKFLEGGMGRVYKGKVIETVDFRLKEGQYVAIKVLYRELTRNSKNVNRERETAQIQLRQENLLEVYDFIEYQGIFHTISEWLNGVSLDDYVEDLHKSGNAFPPEKAYEIVFGVLSGLNFLHQHVPPIFHRDIKPDNIMLCEDGRIKVMDFGIARIANESRKSRTVVGTVIGALHFAPPEQIKGRHDLVNASSDIYALGNTIYKMFVGKAPFDGLQEYEVMEKQVKEALEDHPNIPLHFQNFIKKATQKEQELRFLDADEAITFLKEEPVPKPVRGNRKRQILFLISLISLIALGYFGPSFIDGPAVTSTASEPSKDTPIRATPTAILPTEEDIQVDEQTLLIKKGDDNFQNNEFSKAKELFQKALEINVDRGVDKVVLNKKIAACSKELNKKNIIQTERKINTAKQNLGNIEIITTTKTKRLEAIASFLNTLKSIARARKSYPKAKIDLEIKNLISNCKAVLYDSYMAKADKYNRAGELELEKEAREKAETYK